MAPAPETEAPTDPGATEQPQQHDGFHVRLEHFEGPFDLLLQLISRRRLDITEVALAVVTDEFLAHLNAQDEWDLDEASEFLVVAATLLDLKAARLLPAGEVEDETDLELLEARDLLFARLLQYRAFAQVAAELGRAWAETARSYPRTVPLDPEFAALLPEIEIAVGRERFARIAARALSPRPAPPTVSVAHLHHPVVAVADEAAALVARLRSRRTATFRDLTRDAPTQAHVVARFLALLELYRGAQVAFEQPEALGELVVRWAGTDDGEVAVADDYDDAPAPDTAGPRTEEDG